MHSLFAEGAGASASFTLIMHFNAARLMSACYRSDKLTSHSHTLLVYTQTEGATTKLSMRVTKYTFPPFCLLLQQDLLIPNTELKLVTESLLLFNKATCTSFKSQTTLLSIINVQLFPISLIN